MDVLVERYQRRKQVSDQDSPKLFYLRQMPKTCRKVSTKTLATAVQQKCAMTKGDVKHVIEALVEEIQANLANGNKVKLDQLGTFHMTFHCPGVETSDQCTVRNISRVNIRFVPGKELRLVNGTNTRTDSPANVSFALDKEDEDSNDGSGNGSGGTGGSGSGDSGSGSGGSGVIDDNPLG